MNTIRNTFLVLFVCLAFLLAAIAAVQLCTGQSPAISWIGLLLASASPLAFLGFRHLMRRRGEDFHPIVFSGLCGLGVAISMTASWKFGNAAGQIHIWSGICLIAWFVFIRWFGISKAPEPSPRPHE